MEGDKNEEQYINCINGTTNLTGCSSSKVPNTKKVETAIIEKHSESSKVDRYDARPLEWIVGSTT